MKKQFTNILITSVFLIFGVFTLISQANAETGVSGIITSNTVWTLSNSPYNITGTIQIPEGVTLSVEPGVVIIGSGRAADTENLDIEVWGRLAIIGNENLKIKLNNVFIAPGIHSDNATSSAVIDIEYADINSGGVYNAYMYRYGSLKLTDSVINSLKGIYNNGIYIHSIQGDSYIERNIFINSNGIKMYLLGGHSVFIKNNVFINTNGNFAILTPDKESDRVTVEYNSFLNTDKVFLRCNTIQSNGNLVAINNYWGTDDSNKINSMIFDKNDDLNCSVNIDYQPILNSPHTDTPIMQICSSWTYSDWTLCNSGQQTRTVISSSPSNCISGNPVLTQSCTDAPPACTTWNYSNWSACSSNSQQTRTIVSSLPSGCAGGSSTVIQSCVYAPSTPISSTVEAQTEVTLDSSVQTAKVMAEEKEFTNKIDTKLVKRLVGRILLQVEQFGQAWYLDPVSLTRHYLADGQSSYEALRKFGLGIKNSDILKIPVGQELRFSMTDTDNDGLPDKLEEALGTNPLVADTNGNGVSDGDEVLKENTNPSGTGKLIYSNSLIDRLKGRIVIQTEGRGEAWYINPVDGKRYYLANGEAAYQIMRYLSLGINNVDIRKITVGN